MRRSSLARTMLVVAWMLVLSSLAATAWSSDAPPPRTGGEFVVRFEGSVENATAAIQDAGGTVLDVNEAIGLALVSSLDEEFPNNIRAEAAVTGAARNSSIATVRPGMPRRFADERPEVYGPPKALQRAEAAPPPVAAAALKKEEPLNACNGTCR